jgi:hypothetical protein
MDAHLPLEFQGVVTPSKARLECALGEQPSDQPKTLRSGERQARLLETTF